MKGARGLRKFGRVWKRDSGSTGAWSRSRANAWRRGMCAIRLRLNFVRLSCAE